MDEAAVTTFLAETIVIIATTEISILENHDLLLKVEEEAAVVEEEVDEVVEEEVAAAGKIGSKWPRNLRGLHPLKVGGTQTIHTKLETTCWYASL